MADRAAVTRGAVRGPDVAQVPGQVRPVGNGFHVIGLTCAAVLANPAHPAVIRDRVPGEPLPAFALGRRHAVRLAARAARQRNAHTRNDNDRRQMMASPFGPGETAAVDQALAASDEDLDGLLRAIRGLIAGDGREQAMAGRAVTLPPVRGRAPQRHAVRRGHLLIVQRPASCPARKLTGVHFLVGPVPLGITGILVVRAELACRVGVGDDLLPVLRVDGQADAALGV